MPVVHTPTPQSRRNFLRGTVHAAAGVLYTSHALAQETSPDTERRWALMADSHVPTSRTGVHRGTVPFDHLKQAAAAVASTKPSASIIVGDVALSDGKIAEYELVKEAIAPLAKSTPVFMGMGNHDHRDRFRKVFPDEPAKDTRQAVTNKEVLVIDQAPVVRMVLLDSLWNVNQAPGDLGQAQRDWLDSYLKSTGSDEVPTVIAVHHTFGRGGGHLRDTDAFFKILEAHPQVKAVLYGHSHRYQITRRGQLHLINLPPVSYNFDGVTPLGWLDATFNRSGAKLTLKTIDPKHPRANESKSLAW